MSNNGEDSGSHLQGGVNVQVNNAAATTTTTTAAATENETILQPRHPLSTERNNIIHILNLVIKDLIDSAVNYRAGSGNCRKISEHDQRLNLLFIIVEHCICHGLKSAHPHLAQEQKRLNGSGGGGNNSTGSGNTSGSGTSLSSSVTSPFGLALRWAGNTVFQDWDNGPDPWAVVQLVPKIHPEAMDLARTTTEMVNAMATTLGRTNNSLLKTRIWMRLAFMQKRLGEYLRSIIDYRFRLKLDDLYHEEALFLQEEGAVAAGLLLGLNVIDVTFVLRDIRHLSYPLLNAIDYSCFMKKAFNNDSCENLPAENDDASDELKHLLDQNNYLEELSEHQRKNMEGLQIRLSQAENALQKCRKDLAETQGECNRLKEDQMIRQAEKDSLCTEFERQKKRMELDIETERDAYNTSRIGLDQLNADLRRRLKEETDARLEAEKALDTEMKRKVDGEATASTMEQQLLDKINIITNLRRQVDEVKSMQLETTSKLRESEESLRHKVLLVTRLEEKNLRMNEVIEELERKIVNMEQEKRANFEEHQKLLIKLSSVESRCGVLESDERIQAEIRSNMQHQCDNLKKEKEAFREKIRHLEPMQEECNHLRKQVSSLEKRCCEQEMALEEMAEYLTQSKLEAEQLRERQAVTHEATWADDKNVNDCRQCRKAFSVSRRKHHCRHCGGIFCNECSINKMTLPSSAKPVRVCDMCHTTLLERCIVR